MLVVQGIKDRFGMPASAGDRKVVEIEGDHSLRSDRKRSGKRSESGCRFSEVGFDVLVVRRTTYERTSNELEKPI